MSSPAAPTKVLCPAKPFKILLFVSPIMISSNFVPITFSTPDSLCEFMLFNVAIASSFAFRVSSSPFV